MLGVIICKSVDSNNNGSEGFALLAALGADDGLMLFVGTMLGTVDGRPL